MEQLSLPIPSLQFLAAHAVGRRMVLMKADKAYWRTNLKDSLRECELRVDKLPLRPSPREYVRNVLRGFFLQVKEWVFHNDDNPSADILVDARGNVDKRGTIRYHFENRYKDEFFREDFRKVVPFLEYLSWYYPKCCNNDFVSIIANLQEVHTSLEGPEYRIVDGGLHVVFRFVNRHRVPSAFNALLEWNRHPLTIFVEQKDVLVTYCVYKYNYDEDMFRIHVDLLLPSQRLEFVKEVLHQKMRNGLFEQVFRFLNVLDPELRQNCLLSLNEDRYHFKAFRFLECLLIPGYESLFIPMLKLVGLNLDWDRYFRLFYDLVNQIDLIGFDCLLLQFWKLLPASKKTMFHTALESHDAEGHSYITYTMHTLLRANMALYQVLSDEMSASPPKKKARFAL